jgi:hypothetical protein
VPRNSASDTSSDGRSADRRRQRAGFSIFVDQVVDQGGGQRWESRLYHAESGAETTLPGASPDQWLAWVLEHLGTQATLTEGRREPIHPAVEVLAVEVLDVTVTEESATRAESTHRIAAGGDPTQRPESPPARYRIARSEPASRALVPR